MTRFRPRRSRLHSARGERDDVLTLGNGVLGAERIGGSRDVSAVLDAVAVREAARDLDHRQLAHPVDQQVGLRVQENGAPDLVLPEVVVHEAAQRRLDTPTTMGTPGSACRARDT